VATTGRFGDWVMIYADIEYSKQLKDEFPDSELWHIYPCQSHGMIPWGNISDKEFADKWNQEYIYPALTTDMLLERLPARLRLERADYWLSMAPIKDNSAYDVRYKGWVGGILPTSCEHRQWQDTHKWFQETKLCDALAKMLIWLKKEGLL